MCHLGFSYISVRTIKKNIDQYHDYQCNNPLLREITGSMKLMSQLPDSNVWDLEHNAESLKTAKSITYAHPIY